MNILIIAAHPDDEVLGMGATIKKLTKMKHVVHLCVISEGTTAQYKNKNMIQIRKKSCVKAGKILGISSFYFLDFPDMKLDSIPSLEINKKLENIIEQFKPEVVYTTPNDINKDHKIVYESTLVITRPKKKFIKQILCYEIPNFASTPFQPSLYENIVKEFPYKIKAFKCYKTEIEKFPHPRSLTSIKNLAIQRGIESGLKKAESFQIIRKIID